MYGTILNGLRHDCRFCSTTASMATRGRPPPHIHGYEQTCPTGGLAKYLLNMGLQKATQTNWGVSEPHMYVREVEPIDAVWFSLELDITSTMQLSFHEGVGDHGTVLVDIATKLAIGKPEFRVVHPHAR